MSAEKAELNFFFIANKRPYIKYAPIHPVRFSSDPTTAQPILSYKVIGHPLAEVSYDFGPVSE